MTRSILSVTFTLLFLVTISGAALSQDFMLQDSDDAVVAASKESTSTPNVFEDTNFDGIPDTLTVNGVRASCNLRLSDAQGFKYTDGRSIVFYPSDWMGPLPDMGTSKILGFIHYFDDQYLSTFLAIVAEQAVGDDTTNGLAVFFYDSAGLRVGAPTTVFMEKARLRAIPIYQEWVQMGIDYGIGSNPTNSKFFVYAKDLNLQDDILIVMFQLYQ